MVGWLGKKANLAEDWVEYLAFTLLVIGFFISAVSHSAVISYVIVFLCGMMGGRIMFRVKKGFKTAWFTILFGFLIGFVLGSRYGDARFIIILYCVGIFAAYYLHDKGYIKSEEY